MYHTSKLMLLLIWEILRSLFNLDGDVIGINSQIYSRSGGNEGLAFAIPINVAMEVVEQLKSDGFSRGYLGVQGGDVTSDLAKALGMEYWCADQGCSRGRCG